MRAEQPIKLRKLRRKMRLKVAAPSNRIKPPVITCVFTDRPKTVFRCGFICFMFRAVQFLNVLHFCVVLLFNLVKLTELPPV